jgi:hypothetical protein
MNDAMSQVLSVALRGVQGLALGGNSPIANDRFSDSAPEGNQLKLPGYERADVRAAASAPDDGGERLSTAPSALELNGRASREHWRVASSAAYADLALRNRFSESLALLGENSSASPLTTSAEKIPSATVESQQCEANTRASSFGQVRGEQCNANVLWLRIPTAFPY